MTIFDVAYFVVCGVIILWCVVHIILSMTPEDRR